MGNRSSALSFRQSKYREDSQFRGSLTIEGKINKGRRQGDGKLHQSDLGEYLRVDASPLDREVWGPDSTLVNAMDLIHETLGEKPGSQRNPLVVKIHTFDELLRNPLFVDACKRPSTDGMNYIIQQISRWAICRAGAKSRDGGFGSIAISDPFAEYLVAEKTPKGWVNYEPKEKLLEETIVLNMPQLGEALFNKNLSTGQECHLYEREDGRKVLVPWAFNGFLEMTIKRMWDAGMTGGFLATINGKTNIVKLTRIFATYLKTCAVYGIDFSLLEFRMYRVKEMISVPGYGKGSIQERRKNRQKKEHWNVTLEPTAQTMQLIERAKKARLEMSLSVRSKTVEENIFDLFGFSGEDEEPVQQPHIAEEEISDDALFEALIGDAIPEPEYLSTGEQVSGEELDDEQYQAERIAGEEQPKPTQVPSNLDWLTEEFLTEAGNGRTKALFEKAIAKATGKTQPEVFKVWLNEGEGILDKDKTGRTKRAILVASTLLYGNTELMHEVYSNARDKACKILGVDEL